MKSKIFKMLDVFFESVYFLIITYTLSSMYTSFKFQWVAIAFGAADLFAMMKYHQSVEKITGSKVAAIFALVCCWIVFAVLAYHFGYIRGEFTPFPSLY